MGHISTFEFKAGGGMQRYAAKMKDFREYLRAYWIYVSTTRSWAKVAIAGLAWLGGMFVPLWAKTLVQIPNWAAFGWMIGWALLGYLFAPYGMWKHHRSQIAGLRRRVERAKASDKSSRTEKRK